jgi:hypothetical protein
MAAGSLAPKLVERCSKAAVAFPLAQDSPAQIGGHTGDKS